MANNGHPSPDKQQTEVERMYELLQAVLIVFVVVFVVSQFVSCCEIYNIIESKK